MHDLSCEGAEPSARAGRHQRRDVDLHHHPIIIMVNVIMVMKMMRKVVSTRMMAIKHYIWYINLSNQ